MAAMTTETTDPLETVMAAAIAYRAFVPEAAEASWDPIRARKYITEALAKERERLRLHVQLALAKARREEGTLASVMGHRNAYYDKQIAALEARLQEQE